MIVLGGFGKEEQSSIISAVSSLKEAYAVNAGVRSAERVVNRSIAFWVGRLDLGATYGT